MGLLVDGQWTTKWHEPDEYGRFVRSKTQFRHWVRTDDGPFVAENGRYHLYLSLACPWAHRVAIMRAIKQLEHAIDISVVDHFMDDQGWRFAPEVEGATADKVNGCAYLREVYLTAAPRFTGRVTVPVLWDRQHQTIVNNESREILRMLDHEFADLAQRDIDLAPPTHLDEIERMIDFVYEPINNGVYKAGFATTQEAYDDAVGELFDALDTLEQLLGRQRWLAGDRFTEADICLFTTLVRFDLVYHAHFKCNRQRIADYPNLTGFVREVYQLPGVAQTCNFDHIRLHYYASHTRINPFGIVAIGPQLDFDQPHGRDRVGGQPALELFGPGTSPH